MPEPRIIDVTELILRDAHQSLMATRMATDDMVPACEDHRQRRLLVARVLGRRHVRLLHPVPQRGPVGAPPHVPRRGCRTRRSRCCCAVRTCWATATTRTRVVDRFVREGRRQRHRRVPGLRRAERHPQPRSAPSGPCAAPASTRRGRFRYTTSPLHTIDGFVKLAEQLRRAGLRFDLHQGHGGAAQAAAGLRSGARASRQRCGHEVRVHVHVHATTGVTLVSLMKAIEAGADCVDTAISSMSLGPGHNPTESLVEMLEGTPYDDRARQGAAADDQGALRAASGRATPSSCRTSPASRPRSSTARFPGGMISNMESQLKQQGAATESRRCWPRFRTSARTRASRRW